MIERCPWAGENALYIHYHDEEWGTPSHDDRKHFEFLVLESAQAGLSWITILRRRDNYRAAYSNFNPEVVAKYKTAEINKLLNNAGIATTVIRTDEDATGQGVRLATMHRVKGLEFPRMILASVHQGEMPLVLPAEAVPDKAALKNHEESERRLLYVASTRARDLLVITGYGGRCAWV